MKQIFEDPGSLGIMDFEFHQQLLFVMKTSFHPLNVERDVHTESFSEE